MKRLYLKRFDVQRMNPEFFSNKPNWLDHKYSTIERLELEEMGDPEPMIEELTAFLEINPNIKHFAIDVAYIWKHRQFLMASKIQLDCLIIIEEDNCSYGYKTIVPKEVAETLKELHERTFFKTFHFRVQRNGLGKSKTQDWIDSLSPLDTLEALTIKISIEYSEDDRRIRQLDIPPLANLKEFITHKLDGETFNAAILATNLINIERLLISTTTLNFILPFVRRSRKLHTVIVSHVQNVGKLDQEYLELFNAERQKLKDEFEHTQKMIFYVHYVYLEMKFRAKSVNFNLIEFRRIESIDCENFWFSF